jgi:Protein of unknown function (DUF2442)
MIHLFKKIVSVEALDHYRLRLGFEDGKISEIDLSSALEGEMFEPLKDEVFFKRVTIDEEAHTIVWPNGADFDPDALYMWNESGFGATYSGLGSHLSSLAVNEEDKKTK